MNLTLSLDGAIVQKVHRVAIDRGTTSNAMASSYPASVAGGATTLSASNKPIYWPQLWNAPLAMAPQPGQGTISVKKNLTG